MTRVCALAVAALLSVAGAPARKPAPAATRDFVVVVDLGSSGSRAFVYQFHGKSVEGSKPRKIGPGVSTLDPRTADLAGYLRPLVDHARSLVPPEKHGSTPMFLKATAGMRLLPEERQRAILTGLYEALVNPAGLACPFRVEPEFLSTISGDDEGYYGALSVNFLSRRIDRDLRAIPEDKNAVEANARTVGEEMVSVEAMPDGSLQAASEFPSGPVFGALDMGGSSTQIVFQPLSWLECIGHPAQQGQPVAAPLASAHSGPGSTTLVVEHEGEDFIDADGPIKGDQCPEGTTLHDGVLDDEDLFVHSFLSFGVNQVRERLWSHLVAAAEAQSARPSTSVENPCGFKGRKDEWHGRHMLGTGNATECMALLRDILLSCDDAEPRVDNSTMRRNGSSSEVIGSDSGSGDALPDAHGDGDANQTPPAGCSLSGQPKTPPVEGVPFVAMSVYFFAVDCMRHLTGTEFEHWPSPSLRELSDAAEHFCSLEWTNVSSFSHPWTWEDQLPHRCFETVYIVTVLQHAYGFDPDVRSIQFALEVGGMEVEWTLGFALAAMAEQRSAAEES